MRLLFFCSVILGVLRKVTKTTSLFDALNNLVVFLALTISQFIDKLLTASGVSTISLVVSIVFFLLMGQFGLYA